MKQLTCEMCGSTDLVKQDGFFVCQTCGCKYSVEEARKMMIEGTVEVQGKVEVKNAAKIENLLTLAESSYAADNYERAEDFCDKIIAMDDANYRIWQLKGLAIAGQTTLENPRGLEACSCLVSSYNILKKDGEDKSNDELKTGTLKLIEGCCNREMDGWMEQIETNGLTETILDKVGDCYGDLRNRIRDACFEMEVCEDEEQKCVCKFDSAFIELVIRIFDLSLNDLNSGLDLDRDTCYALINLFKTVEYYFNEQTSLYNKNRIYDGVILFEKKILREDRDKARQKYIALGFSSDFVVSQMKIAAIDHEEIIKIYENKKIDAEQQAKEKRIKVYWNSHKTEKDALDNEKKSLEEFKANATAQLAELKKSKEKVPSLELFVKKQKEIAALETQKNALGFFKFKEKKELQLKIDALMVEKNKIKTKVNGEQQEIETEINSVNIKLNKAIARIKEIDNEFTMDRDDDDE